MRILLFLIILTVLFIHHDLNAQVISPFRKKFLENISDLVGTSGKGFQIQLGTGFTWSEEEDAKSYQFIVPVIIPRYAFNDHIGIQGEVSLDINNYRTGDDESVTDTEISQAILGAVYEFDPDTGFKFLNQFSVNLDHTIPFKQENYSYTEIDFNASTIFSERTELDYSFGYGYQNKGDDAGVYSLGLDYYFSRTLLLEVTNYGNWNWNNASKTFTHFIEAALLLLNEKGIQLDLVFIKGLNQNYNFTGITFIKNLF